MTQRVRAPSTTRILRLNKAGMPLSWLTREEAATLVVKGQVVWSLGDQQLEIRGGFNCLGRQTILLLPTIIATEGNVFRHREIVPYLCNRMLFRRDQNLCLYCGRHFSHVDLTRDHIIAKCRGGLDTWTNLVTACRRCNQRKGNESPESAGMALLAVPFVPNQVEYLALANRNILADQMVFLKSGFSKNMRAQ
ncbi:MAG: HNH endonuclease [Pseudomonadales bacterium]|nr:HNH endonuclease [Pseudomonadales bacterium]